jgi:hypothetical protein
VNLLYLNVLIAMMSKSFERVEEAASGMSRLALASSLVTWEAILPSAVRKRKHEALIPPKGSKKKIVKMTLYEGLGWLNFLPYYKAQGKQVSEHFGTLTRRSDHPASPNQLTRCGPLTHAGDPRRRHVHRFRKDR